MGSGSSLLSCRVFLPPPLSQAFLLLVAGHMSPLPPEPVRPTRLVYLQSREGFPSPTVWHSVCPTLFPACLYCSYCLLLSFSFFPEWRSVCPGGCAALAQGFLWEYCGTTKLTLSVSSQVVWARATGGPGAVLISLFNMKWRCSAPAGCAEGLKFCLFSLVLPARSVSSVSPRFHYRRHAFCFLPLAPILEFPFLKFLEIGFIMTVLYVYAVNIDHILPPCPLFSPSSNLLFLTLNRPLFMFMSICFL
jgi:hypothetical protein